MTDEALQVDVVQSHEGFVALREDWEAVHAADPESHYFLSWRWLAEVFAAHPDQWQVLAVRPRGDGTRHVAFLPLYVMVRRGDGSSMPFVKLLAAGQLLLAQYTGFVCDPELEPQVVEALGRRLRKMPYSELKVKNWPEGRRLRSFLDQFPERDFRIRFGERLLNDGTVDNQTCPYVELPDDFDTYLRERVSANTRQKIRRFSRRVEESGGLRFTASDEASFPADLDRLFELWGAKWTSSLGLAETDESMTAMRASLGCSHALGATFLPMLWRGDRLVGALAHIVDREAGRLYFIVAGRDQEAPEPYIGLVLHAHSIRWAIEHGLRTYDLCHGDEAYKYSLGADDRRVVRFSIRRRTPIGTPTSFRPE